MGHLCLNRDLESNICITTGTETRTKASLKIISTITLKVKQQSPLESKFLQMCRSNQVSVTRPGHAMLPALRNRSWFTKSHLNRLFTVPCCYERLMRISAKSVYLNQAYSLKTTGKASQPPPSRSWAPIIGDREQSNHISSKTLNGLNV